MKLTHVLAFKHLKRAQLAEECLLVLTGINYVVKCMLYDQAK